MLSKLSVFEFNEFKGKSDHMIGMMLAYQRLHANVGEIHNRNQLCAYGV